MRELWAAAWTAVRRFARYGGPDAAAALAFYGLFSLFPLLLLAVALLTYLVPLDTARRLALELAASYAPWARDLVELNVDHLFAVRRRLGTVGLVGSVWAASHVFAALSRALDRVWPPPAPITPWHRRLWGLAAAGVAALLLAALGVGVTALTVMGRGLGIAPAPAPSFTGAVAWLAGFLATLAAYRLAPSSPPSLREAWPGALLAAVLLHLARSAFAAFVAGLGRHQLVYGTIGTAIVALAWLYVTFTSVLLGAEFAAAFSGRRRGSRSGP